MPGLCLWAQAGQNWTRLELVVVMGSLTRWGYHTQWVCEGAYTQVCARAMMYEDTNLPTEPQGHGLAAINKQPLLSVRR